MFIYNINNAIIILFILLEFILKRRLFKQHFHIVLYDQPVLPFINGFT